MMQEIFALKILSTETRFNIFFKNIQYQYDIFLNFVLPCILRNPILTELTSRFVFTNLNSCKNASGEFCPLLFSSSKERLRCFCTLHGPPRGLSLFLRINLAADFELTRDICCTIYCAYAYTHLKYTKKCAQFHGFFDSSSSNPRHKETCSFSL